MLPESAHLGEAVGLREADMRVLYIAPVGSDIYLPARAEICEQAGNAGTAIDIVSLPLGRPTHVEYHAYEAMVLADVVKHSYAAANKYDAFVIGCFYDLGLREAREVSGRTVVTAPCQASTSIAMALGNTFSILVGRRKWIPKMSENVRTYGLEHAMSSMRAVDLGVHDFQSHAETEDRLMETGRRCVEDDGAEVLILGCTAEFGFHEKMQDELGVPVLDPMLSALKYAEMLVDGARRFGWYPSRKWGSEAPSEEEIAAWGLFDGEPPTGTFIEAGSLAKKIPAE